MRRCLVAAVVVLVLSPALHGAPPPAHRLKVTLDADLVQVERATPGGSVLLVGYELGARDFARMQTRVHRQETAGADGSARLRVGRDIAPSSFWVAFDLSSGGHGAVAASKHALREADIPKRFLAQNGATIQKILVPLEYVYVLVVRPGAGAWELTVADGGPSDDDGALNGVCAIAASRLEARDGTTVESGEMREGDVVAVFAPAQMAYLMTEVKQ